MDLEQYLRFALALVFVLVLIVVIGWIFRRLGFGSAVPTTSRQRRLNVVEAVALDAKRRLVLVRRDDVEHLILLGASGDLVIEPGIRPSFRDAIAAAERDPDLTAERRGVLTAERP